MNTRHRISRRSFLSTSAAVVAGLGFAGTSNPWAYAQTREPVALALTVGLNSIDPGKYGTAGRLQGPEEDARTMQRIAINSGRFAPANTITLTASATNPALQATNANVLRHIAWAAAILKPRDLFLLTYSGHGSQTSSDPSGDEVDDRRDETWCLFDGHLVDDTLYHFWSRFADDVRIVVFADSCHSGTSVKVLETLALVERELIDLPKPKAVGEPDPALALKGIAERFDRAEKSMDKESRLNIINEADQELTSLIKALPEALVPIADSLQADHLRGYRQAYPKALGEFKTASQAIGAKGLLFAACDDSRQALDGSPNSRFTAAVTTALGAQFNQGYSDFFSRISSNPTPKLFPFGQSDTRFHNERLFTVG